MWFTNTSTLITFYNKKSVYFTLYSIIVIKPNTCDAISDGVMLYQSLHMYIYTKYNKTKNIKFAS